MIHAPHEAATPETSSPRYEAPRVIEDLPLESFSLTCGKSDAVCIEEGGELQS